MHKHHAILAAFSLLVALFLSGCHLQPEIDGADMFLNVRLHHGETAEFTIPADRHDEMTWRVDSYDSGKLQMVGQPQLVRQGDTRYYRASFRAGDVGTSEVIFRRTINTIGDNRKKFTIIVSE